MNMHAPTTELLFPPRLIPSLRDLRDSDWIQLVDPVLELEPSHIKQIALELLIVRWCGCVNCQADSFRAMQGCAQCATLSIRRYRGSKADLQRLFADAVQEIETYLNLKE